MNCNEQYQYYGLFFSHKTIIHRLCMTGSDERRNFMQAEVFLWEGVYKWMFILRVFQRSQFVGQCGLFMIPSILEHWGWTGSEIVLFIKTKLVLEIITECPYGTFRYRVYLPLQHILTKAGSVTCAMYADMIWLFIQWRILNTFVLLIMCNFRCP